MGVGGDFCKVFDDLAGFGNEEALARNAPHFLAVHILLAIDAVRGGDSAVLVRQELYGQVVFLAKLLFGCRREFGNADDCNAARGEFALVLREVNRLARAARRVVARIEIHEHKPVISEIGKEVCEAALRAIVIRQAKTRRALTLP